ncbi:hypothetical protein C5E22_03875 [Pectobacterium parmentieri]|uniref:Uncharacterized protein n=1 Tax=Pectobacterium parmentieri TaxID=1905730 RepID=A0A8B3FHF6_PECPM|nr:hypothetical protein A8F97_00275 [Pectobacterium parmentieri]AYH17678.1 hypothetical protein C5E22_03875 [Pectobacterium parmentieri]AYH37885.1 hypothetical protein C5E17_18640 [Pectobacterium parmentieri]AZS58113.1 hypothetical protein C5E18_19325 [Pectobacterium parmentieri]RKO77660.1 hypothetical protein C5E00_13120 [Pectobacterium parmentieri]
MMVEGIGKKVCKAIEFGLGEYFVRHSADKTQLTYIVHGIISAKKPGFIGGWRSPLCRARAAT